MLLYYALFVLPVIALVSVVGYLPWAWAGRREKKSLLCHLTRYALIGCALSLLYLTILWYYPDITFRPEYYFLNLRPFVWLTEVYEMGARRMVEQLVTNVVMFVPWGFLLPAAMPKLRRWLPALGTVLATTVGIETVQFFIGRSADIDDVIMNFFDGALGYGLYRLLNRALADRPWWQHLLGTPLNK